VPRSTKVLVVEDDRHTREIVARALTQDVKLRYLNIELIQAADGEEGLEMFREHHPALLIVDLLLPKLNGFKLVEIVRQEAEGGDCPILVTTGVYRDRKNLKQLEDKDVQLQLKPFLPQALANAVHQMLVRRRPADTRPPATRPARITPSTPRQPSVLIERVRRSSRANRLHADGEVGEPGSEAQAVSGDLTELSVPLLLLDALEEQLSGTLDLRHGKVRKVVHLTAGHPVFVQSNLRGETLGQMLVKRGKLTRDQHEGTLALSEREKIKYGQALVRLGLLSDGEVMEELREQTRLKLAACLRWREGRWVFTEDPDVDSKVPRCVVDPVLLVFECMQRRTDIEEAFARLGDKSDHHLQLTGRFALYRDRFTEVFGGAVVDVLSPEHTVREVIRAAGSPQDAVLQINALLEIGLANLEPPHEPKDIAARISAQMAVPLDQLAVLSPEPALAQEREIEPEEWEESSAVVWISPEERPRFGERRERESAEVQVALQLIHSTYLTLHDANHYQVLGVTPKSDADSIEVAYQVKRKQFDLGNFRDLDLGEHYAHLEEICTALDRAFEVLSDTKQRRAYDETLGRSEAEVERSHALEAEMHCRRGEELFNLERYRKAMEAFGKAVEVDAQAEYQSKFALAYFMANRNRELEAAGEAMVLVQDALATDPDDQTAHLVAATISREVGHDEEALYHLQELIKMNPASREAFDVAEQILLEQRDLDALELQYRRALHLLGDRDMGWSGELWVRLMRLYQDELGDPERARTAGEVALRLRPDDQELRALVAEMDHKQPDRWPQAVLGYRSLLRSDPAAGGPIHRLFELHETGGRVDAAFTAACAAELRGVASETERRFVEVHRPKVLRRCVRPLEPSLLESLRHPDDDPALATLFRVLTPLVQRLHPLRLEDLDLGEKDIIPPERLPEGFSSVLRYVAEQLSVSPPAVALNPGLGLEVQSAGTEPPLLIASMEALESASRFELCFRAARALNLLGPGRRLAAWWPRRTLRDYVLAALSVAYPEVDVPDRTGLVGKIQHELHGAELQAAVKGAVASLRERAGTLNLADWQRGIHRTADRVGLLLCTDLLTAGKVLAAQDEEAERDLVDFALGETFGELRQSLGLALE
jgi:DNA-binding response OmpR family regulator/tetratricopeptide (TPR) repeat protein